MQYICFWRYYRSQTTLRQKDEKQLYQVQFVDLRTSITQPASVPRWTMYINEGKKPSAFVSNRASHSVVKIDHRMYIFGGVSGFMDSVTVHNDLWSYSIRTKSWRNEYNKPIQSVLQLDVLITELFYIKHLLTAIVSILPAICIKTLCI